MKLFVVQRGEKVLGVFSSYEKAQEACSEIIAASQLHFETLAIIKEYYLDEYAI